MSINDNNPQSSSLFSSSLSPHFSFSSPLDWPDPNDNLHQLDLVNLDHFNNQLSNNQSLSGSSSSCIDNTVSSSTHSSSTSNTFPTSQELVLPNNNESTSSTPYTGFNLQKSDSPFSFSLPSCNVNNHSGRRKPPNPLNLLNSSPSTYNINPISSCDNDNTPQVVSPLVIWRQHHLNYVRRRSFSTNTTHPTTIYSIPCNTTSMLLSPPVFGSCPLFPPLSTAASFSPNISGHGPSFIDAGKTCSPPPNLNQYQQNHVIQLKNEFNFWPHQLSIPLTGTTTDAQSVVSSQCTTNNINNSNGMFLNAGLGSYNCVSSGDRVTLSNRSLPQPHYTNPTPNTTPDPYIWSHHNQQSPPSFQPSSLYLDLPQQPMGATPPMSLSPPITPPAVSNYSNNTLIHNCHSKIKKRSSAATTFTTSSKRRRSTSCYTPPCSLPINHLLESKKIINGQSFIACPIINKHELLPHPVTDAHHIRGIHINPIPGENKPYTCPHPGCLARFARNHDLKRHELIHSGIKVFKCPECGRAFGRRDALARHTSAPGNRCKAMFGKRRVTTPSHPSNSKQSTASVDSPISGLGGIYGGTDGIQVDPIYLLGDDNDCSSD